MVIDETQCQAVLDAENADRPARSSSPSTTATRPSTRRSRNCSWRGEIGTVTSVDFNWYLDTTHGADYFRRWHRLRVEERIALGAQGVAPFRSGQLVARRRAGARCRRSAASRTTARTDPFRHTNCRTLPAQGQVPLLLGHQQEPEPRRALRRVRVGRRLSARRLRVQGRHRHLRHDERGRAVFERRQHELLGQHLHAGRGLPPRLQRRRKAGSRCATTSASRGIPAKRPRCYLIKNFGKRAKIEVPSETEGHGGGDQRLRDLIFREDRRASAHAPARLARGRDVVPYRDRGA